MKSTKKTTKKIAPLIFLTGDYFTPDKTESVIYAAEHSLGGFDLIKKRDRRAKKTYEYYNVPCSFDIETSSFMEDGQKRGIMYAWAFSICGFTIFGRTWEQYYDMLADIQRILQLSEDRRLVVYVHNLAWEFQFLRHREHWINVFAIELRRPIYAVSDIGIEYRCSYILTGYSLATVAETLTHFKIKKLVGDLDYKLIRHSATYMTEQEIQYVIHDVLIVVALIAERIDHDGDITKIPLTQTGYVRKLMQRNCFTDPVNPKNKYKRLRYSRVISNLTVTLDEYKQLKRAFQGGFTHANPFRSGKVFDTPVTSWDITSSYPTSMIAFKEYPMSSSQYFPTVDYKTFCESIKYYACIFDIEFIGIAPKVWADNPISVSKCWDINKPTINNGRIVSADSLCTTITNIDFDIIRRFYTCEKYRVFNLRRYRKGYLPTSIIQTVLDLYSDKTTLKDVSGREEEYMHKKQMVNSVFGCCVMDIVRDEHTYSDDWDELKEDKEIDPDAEIQRQLTVIDEYNKNPNRFLYYPWGVFITALSRRALFFAILECSGNEHKDSDYIYSDTDSVKIMHSERHTDFFNKYNDWITQQLIAAVEYHRLDTTKLCPQTVKGESKPLGVWDFDGEYAAGGFKTLGAKRYLVKYSDDPRNGKKCGKMSLTVSGLNKKVAVPYLRDKYGDDIFSAFTDNLTVPAGYSGRNTHTYIDTETSGKVYDYEGVAEYYHEYSSIHLSESEYSLSISKQYANFLLDIQASDTFTEVLF